MFEDIAKIEEIDKLDGDRAVEEKFREIIQLLEEELWNSKNASIFFKGTRIEESYSKELQENYTYGIFLALNLFEKFKLVQNSPSTKSYQQRVVKLIDDIGNEKRLLESRIISMRNYKTARYTFYSTIMAVTIALIAFFR